MKKLIISALIIGAFLLPEMIAAQSTPRIDKR